MKISVAQSVTKANDAIAQRLRDDLKSKGIFTINLMSGPGSGKTALIEETVRYFAGRFTVAVIEGDPHTDIDRQRVAAAGARAIQINTQGGCHLDATMVQKAVKALNLSTVQWLFIENVGNLLCPGVWDLGEEVRAVVVSLPEGADKPFKYPETFLLAHMMVVNKIDLEPVLKTKVMDIVNNARLVNPELEIFPVSCETGRGIPAWCEALIRRRAAARR